jgi:hypothetical protein
MTISRITNSRITIFAVLARMNQLGAVVFLTLTAVSAYQTAFVPMLFWLACAITSAVVAKLLLDSVKQLVLQKEDTERFVAGLMAQLTDTGDFAVFMTPPALVRNLKEREQDIIRIAAEVHQEGRGHR